MLFIIYSDTADKRIRMRKLARKRAGNSIRHFRSRARGLVIATLTMHHGTVFRDGIHE